MSEGRIPTELGLMSRVSQVYLNSNRLTGACAVIVRWFIRLYHTCVYRLRT